MKKKVFSILLTLVLVLTLGLVTALPVGAATTIHVPGNYGTIQEAINAAGPGDIILVTGGTYPEDLVIPAGKGNLELMGTSGALIQGVATFPGPFPDGVPNIDILSSGVKIHGFTIAGPSAIVDRYSMGMYIGAANVEIYDNDFLTHTQATGQYSVVIQTYRTGILVGVDISGLNIHDNTFGDVEHEAVGYDGIFINLDTGSGPVTIVGNTFTGSLFRAISVERSNVVIGGNSIITDLAPYDAGTGGYQGIYIGCFPVDGGVPLQTDVSIIGNTVGGGITGQGFVQGIRVGHSSAPLGFTGIAVLQNTVQFNTEGIVVKAPTGANVGVVINYNNILANTDFGVNNYTAVSIDATLNWWGTTDEATIVLMVSGDVDFTDWLGGWYSPSAVTMSAAYTYIPPVIGITVEPLSVIFGEVEPGTPALGSNPVTVTNIGDVAVDLSAAIIKESPLGVYSADPPGLTIDASTVDAWTGSAAVGGDSGELPLVLTVPIGTEPGTYTATLVFWAIASP